MKVEAVLQGKGRDVVTVAPSATVAEAVDVIHNKRIGAVLVVGDGTMGIFSERDVVRGIAETGREMLDRPVSEFMTSVVHSCTRSNTVQEVMGMMTRRRIRHVPVIEDGVLLGIVSIGDAVKARIAETELEASALKEYITAG
ncbi:MAG: CBS domain-containing protein [Alphaproteobacteria bacterium]|nr:CBS domain-containing protein [Alphaproteobacteria bacterium]